MGGGWLVGWNSRQYQFLHLRQAEQNRGALEPKPAPRTHLTSTDSPRRRSRRACPQPSSYKLFRDAGQGDREGAITNEEAYFLPLLPLSPTSSNFALSSLYEMRFSSDTLWTLSSGYCGCCPAISMS